MPQLLQKELLPDAEYLLHTLTATPTCSSAVPLWLLASWSSCEGMPQLLQKELLPDAEYLLHTLTATPTCSSAVPLWLLASWSSCEGMLQLLQKILLHNAVTTEYPQPTLTATPACSSHCSNALYKSYVASQSNQDMWISLLCCLGFGTLFLFLILPVQSLMNVIRHHVRMGDNVLPYQLGIGVSALMDSQESIVKLLVSLLLCTEYRINHKAAIK